MLSLRHNDFTMIVLGSLVCRCAYVFVCLFRYIHKFCVFGCYIIFLIFFSSSWILCCIVAKIERLLEDGYMTRIVARSTTVWNEQHNRQAHSEVCELFRLWFFFPKNDHFFWFLFWLTFLIFVHFSSKFF